MRAAGLAQLQDPVDPAPGNDFSPAGTNGGPLAAGPVEVTSTPYTYNPGREHFAYVDGLVSLKPTPSLSSWWSIADHFVKFSTHGEPPYANDVTSVTLPHA